MLLKFIKKLTKVDSAPSIVFLDQGNNKYILKPGLDARGVINGQDVCAVERLQINGGTLKIDHFAITSYEVGQSEGQGEKCIREFAALIASQNSNINNIDFYLYSTTPKIQNTPSLLQKVADARENLLNKIGATNVHQNQISPMCIEVSGTWPKQRWK